MEAKKSPNPLLILSVMLLLVGAPSVATADAFYFVTFDYPPFEYEDELEKSQGIVVEIVSEIIAALGHSVRIEVFPWTRALNMVRTGKADAIFTAYKNTHREQFLDFSREVLFMQKVHFFRKKGRQVRFDGNFDTLQAHTIGVVSTISYGEHFDRAKTGLNLDKSSRLEHGFHKLILERIDLLPSEILVAQHTIRAMGIESQVEVVPVLIQSVPSFIAFTRARPLQALRDRFDRHLAKMKRDGGYDAIVQKYASTTGG